MKRMGFFGEKHGDIVSSDDVVCYKIYHPQINLTPHHKYSALCNL